MTPYDHLEAFKNELECIPMDPAWRIILLDILDQYGHSMYEMGYEDGYERCDYDQSVPKFR